MPASLEDLTNYLKNNHLKIATAESCTGGLLSAALTQIPGSSAFFDSGFITYSNESKINLLGVTKDIIEKNGAVSAETARAMAHGVLAKTMADIAISVTGIAGPDGGSPEKPVGLVFFGIGVRYKTLTTVHHHFTGNRDDIRQRAVEYALEQTLHILKEKP
jgi:nicotinamide-nucleotide amidase